MRVLKVSLEGDITSFRYPLFMVGVQLSYEMPPPATIYGHICSALGEWLDDPAGVQFAYRFTYEAKLQDLEHIHVLSPSSGKLAKGSSLRKVLEGNVQPFKRELLYRPRLTLYLNHPEWEPAFRSPRYPVVLGRSQDLCMYTDVRVIELAQQERAYFEHTLIPFDYPLKLPQGIVVHMPRFLDYRQNRYPTFARYVVLKQRVFTDDERIIYFGQRPDYFWVDPTSPEIDGARMGLIFSTFQ